MQTESTIIYTKPSSPTCFITTLRALVSAAVDRRSIGAISMGDLNTGELKAFYSGNTDKVSYIEREKYPNWIEQFALAPSKQPQEMLFYISILTQAFISDPRYKSAVKVKCLWSRYLGQFFIYQGFNENCGWMHTSQV
jgi:hypothetical protein